MPCRTLWIQHPHVIAGYDAKPIALSEPGFAYCNNLIKDNRDIKDGCAFYTCLFRRERNGEG